MSLLEERGLQGRHDEEAVVLDASRRLVALSGDRQGDHLGVLVTHLGVYVGGNFNDLKSIKE